MATCPYCDVALKKVPQRKTRCLGCGQYIFVKNTPDNRSKRLMTEAEAAAAEEAWALHHKDQQVWQLLSGLNLPLNAVELAKARSGNDPRAAALALAGDLALKGDRDAVLICLQLSTREPERTAWQKLLHGMDLAKLKRQGVQMVQLVSLRQERDLCGSCAALVGKIVPADLAMLIMFPPACYCSEKGSLSPLAALKGDAGTYAFAIRR